MKEKKLIHKTPVDRTETIISPSFSSDLILTEEVKIMLRLTSRVILFYNVVIWLIYSFWVWPCIVFVLHAMSQKDFIFFFLIWTKAVSVQKNSFDPSLIIGSDLISVFVYWNRKTSSQEKLLATCKNYMAAVEYQRLLKR